MKFIRQMTLAVLAAATLATASHAADTAPAPDWSLTPKVKLELLNKLGSDALHINVDSNNGSVKLVGTVTKRETKELAGTVARSVQGVKTVNNDLTLAEAAKPGNNAVEKDLHEGEAEVKDAILESKVRIALVDKLGGDGFKVGTEVASGVVTLKFDKAASKDLRTSAVNATQAVSGVAKVVTVDKQS
jgi:hyperosmotically inducible protein